MQRSIIWLRQIAQFSTTISQDHSATAFHFFTSNLGFLAGSDDSPLETALASLMSTSAIFIYLLVRSGIGVVYEWYRVKLCFGVRTDLEIAAGQAGVVES